MSGETDIEKLIKTMQPELSNEEYVFSTSTMDLSSILEIDPGQSYKKMKEQQ